MQRSKFPYTAHSSAKVIRHAVSIDERRAKFRQDLMSGQKDQDQKDTETPANSNSHDAPVSPATNPENEKPVVPQIAVELSSDEPQHLSQPLEEPEPVESCIEQSSDRRPSCYAGPVMTASTESLNGEPRPPLSNPRRRRQFSELNPRQDIQEVWFAGGHADIGGGWTQGSDERWMLSHAPLVWMVQEVERAGLKLHHGKVADLNCHADGVDEWGTRYEDEAARKHFYEALDTSCTTGRIHDCLTFKQGLPRLSVLAWSLMEYLPFRRMDLRPDGSWKVIRWYVAALHILDLFVPPLLT